MIEPNNGQDRFTAERVLRTRPKTYRAIVHPRRFPLFVSVTFR
jgi:hypothetical protein